MSGKPHPPLGDVSCRATGYAIQLERLANPESGAIRQLYRCLRTRFTQVSDQEVVFEEVVEPGFTMPPDLFWEVHAIGFGALTSYFGLAPSIVTWEPIERGAAFRIRLPRRRPVRFVLSWLASWFRRDTADDVCSALLFGHERSLRLECEIAERNVAETALRESNERFRRIIDAVPGVVYQYYQDSDGDGFAFVSAGATELTGYTPEEVIAQPERIWGRINPDDILRVQQMIQESARNGTPWQHEFRFQTKTGDTRWVSSRSIPEPISASGRIMWNGILNDVTEEKQAETQLHARDALLQKLSEQVPGVIYQYQLWLDGRSCFPYASEGICDIYEVTPEEVRISAEAVFGRLHAEDFGAVEESIRRSLESLEPWRCEYRVPLPKRGLRWLEGHAVPERLPDGSTIWHGYICDVTERKRTEQALRESEEQLRLSLRAAGQRLYDIDLTTGNAKVSPEYATMIGHDPATFEESNAKWLERLHPDDREKVCSTFDAYVRGEVPHYDAEFRQRTSTGGWLWTLSIGSIVAHDADGKPLRMLGTHTDISKRKLAEEEIQRARDAAERALADLRIASTRAEQFYRLCEVAGQGIGIARLDSTRTYLNPAFRRLLEIPEGDDVTRRAFWEVVPSENHQFPAETVLIQAHETRSWSGEFDLLTLTGKRVPIINTVVLLRDPDGTIFGYSNIATDITEQKRAERAIRESEARLRVALSAATAVAFVWDAAADSVIRYFSTEPALPTNLHAPESVARPPKGRPRAPAVLHRGASLAGRRTVCPGFRNRYLRPTQSRGRASSERRATADLRRKRSGRGRDV